MIKHFSLLCSAFLITTSSLQAQKLRCKEKHAVKRVQSVVGYLASDELEGRATGSNGEKASANYIAEQFAKYGLSPKGENGFIQTFSITTLRIADGSSELTIGGRRMKMFSDYFPLSYSSNSAEVNADMIDVSFGISTEKRNDYKDKDVKGKIVAINISSPDGIHPHSEWLAWHGINIRVDEAVKHGAVGVLFYKTNDKTESPETEMSLKMKPSSVPVLYLTEVQPQGFLPLKTSIKLKVLTDQDEGHNVIGFKDNGAKTTVIIGAHHDHLGMGEHGNSLAEDPNQIHNGADDNASGVAALIELARNLKKSKKWNRSNNYLFIAFSGEEMGLIGSKYFTENPTIDLATVNYMINMDMVGMLKKEHATLIINGVGTGNYWQQSIQLVNTDKRGIDTVVTTISGIGPSDHTSFYLKEIPAIHFFTGAHEYYHKPTDDAGNLNYPGEVFVIEFITELIKDLNSRDRQTFQSTASADSANQNSGRSSFKVTLGVVPNYTFEGEGMQIDAVREGKPAALAGIVAGDVIVGMNGMSIGSMGDYMEALKVLNPGDSIDVQVRRGVDIITIKVQF
ncbi:MAG: M20/M25/M40 family metallo-hydrolase [Bacteroidetes bacterium]|nr:M20/M25/M40 family metallo-hydrolase [Bacteroidota bacterium]